MAFYTTTAISFCYGQSKMLDEKNGLFEFKFGSSYNQHKSKLQFDLQSEDGVKYYKYIGIDHPTILGEKYDNLIVGFYNDELYFVRASFSFGAREIEKHFIDKLEELFGEGEYLNTQGSATWAYGWESSMNYMQVARDEYANLDPTNLHKIILMLYSKSIQKKILSSDF